MKYCVVFIFNNLNSRLAIRRLHGDACRALCDCNVPDSQTRCGRAVPPLSNEGGRSRQQPVFMASDSHAAALGIHGRGHWFVPLNLERHSK